jgi:uncharacterized Fe-S cluster-containing radical SAM superfamily protein
MLNGMAPGTRLSSDLPVPFDPLDRARETEKLVMRNGMRKYYRFRTSRHYGGIVTADAVGCCFLCAYCWNERRNLCPGEYGTYFSPEQVVEKLRAIGERKGIRLFRVSGAEPVLGDRSFHHLLEVLRAGRFILETNGLVLGHQPGLIDFLVQRDVSVRVSIKGWNPETFEKITGARGEFFSLPILALVRLEEAGIEAWPAVMGDLFGRDGVEELTRVLREKGVPGRIEIEYLERYPFVVENLKRRGWKG